MVSETSICNQALGWLGMPEITGLSQANDSAELCRNNYPFLRDAVLEEAAWTFATAKATSLTAQTDGWGQDYAHDKPLEWISVLRVYRNISTRPYCTSEGWRMESGAVIARQETVYMWGIKRITDTGKFSPLFVQALAARLMMDLAMPLTNNPEMLALVTNLYAAKLKMAKTADGMQGANEQVRSSTLVDARASGGLGRGLSTW